MIEKIIGGFIILVSVLAAMFVWANTEGFPGFVIGCVVLFGIPTIIANLD